MTRKAAGELLAILGPNRVGKMCGVDAIQYLTECTYGKGNLIHRDYGKTAFSFFDRAAGRGVRLIMKPEARDVNYTAMRRQWNPGPDVLVANSIVCTALTRSSKRCKRLM